MNKHLLQTDSDELKDRPIGLECMGIWALATAVMVGMTAGAGALGGAILLASHPLDHYSAAGVATITALGSAILNGGTNCFLIPYMLKEGITPPTCCISDSALNSMVNTGLAYAASGALSALVGYACMGDGDMTGASVVAASATGGAIVGAALGYCCSRGG